MAENKAISQNEYLSLSSEIMSVRKRGEVPLAYVRTYGCQQNVADSERIKGMLDKAGFSFTESVDDADFILFNTCAVREHAEDRVFGNVGALKNIKRKHPSVIIALCGCMMEQEHVAKRIQDSFPFVSLVFGTNCLHEFPRLLYNTLLYGKRTFLRGNTDENVYEGIPIKRDGLFKGFLPIMYGCDNFCSYCIVPYVRGREKSRRPEVVIKEAREMIEAGYKDICLLGQNVNSYGKGLDPRPNFSTLLKEIDKIEGDYILRFMTSHPKDCTKELIDTIAQSKHISHHLHLPFQSGSNRILELMNRRYTREKYLDIINYAKERIPDLSLTSDIIVGFPGETYDDFKETLSLIKEVEFTSLFTFIYSRRKGTPAATMPDVATDDEKSAWFKELLKTQEEIAAKRCENMVGSTQKVLVEEKSSNKEGILSGRTNGNIIVEFAGDESLIGSFKNIKITKARNWILNGELVKE
ncbi:MAG: tRNA (N6-isopentenyl adenosine(37)-C2)-methylthiotransferase MiaB [Ruminococcaceae bacterium]|nr:tRNA (N6-isopentenyl adenosine(37)-C2)-methylthiotransferase MiaB [Oscillospiraceae bacterium]